MGTLRFFLAACVIVGHSSKLPGLYVLDAGMAVKTFFIISGFYMQLILDSKYGRVVGGIKLFYTNRALRIYPMYLITLALAVAFYFAASFKLGHPADRLAIWLQALDLHYYWQLTLIGISQFTIFGLDATPLFTFSPAFGFHLRDQLAAPGSYLAWRLNFLPHCWSIGAELLFYLIMPFFNFCRTWQLILLCLLSATTCFLMNTFAPLLAVPMNYHYGPMQFVWFILGILSYRMIYKGVLRNKAFADWKSYIPVVPFAFLCLSPWWSSGNLSDTSQSILNEGYFVLAAISVPILFQATKSIRWDRWIGELSYPMYLLHIPMKWVILGIMGVSQKDEATVSGVYLLVLTVAVSFGMTYFVDRPLEALRQKRFERRASESLPA